MPPNPETIQAAIALAAFIGAGLAGWWRLTSRLHAFLAAQKDTADALAKLRAQLAYSSRRLAEEMAGVRADMMTLKGEMATFSHMFHEREKDISRLEGALQLEKMPRRMDRS